MVGVLEDPVLLDGRARLLNELEGLGIADQVLMLRLHQ
jgi:hypothetical protein